MSGLWGSVLAFVFIFAVQSEKWKVEALHLICCITPNFSHFRHYRGDEFSASEDETILCNVSFLQNEGNRGTGELPVKSNRSACHQVRAYVPNNSRILTHAIGGSDAIPNETRPCFFQASASRPASKVGQVEFESSLNPDSRVAPVLKSAIHCRTVTTLIDPEIQQQSWAGVHKARQNDPSDGPEFSKSEYHVTNFGNTLQEQRLDFKEAPSSVGSSIQLPGKLSSYRLAPPCVLPGPVYPATGLQGFPN